MLVVIGIVILMDYVHAKMILLTVEAQPFNLPKDAIWSLYIHRGTKIGEYDLLLLAPSHWAPILFTGSHKQCKLLQQTITDAFVDNEKTFDMNLIKFAS